MSNIQRPIVILGFSAAASPLDALWPATHRALLPICGKAMVVHLMESLVRWGYGHVRVAGAVQQQAAKSRLGDGDEWGLRIRYTDIHAADLVNEALAAGTPCVHLNADELHAEALDAPGGTQPMPIRSVQGFHDANQRLVEGQLDLILPGVPIHKFGAYADWKSRVAPDAYVGRHVFVGKHAFVDRAARLTSNCVLSNGVIVGAGCNLENVTVLPNCHIQPDVALSDAVVAPEGIYELSADGQPTFREAGDLVRRSRANEEAHTGLPDPLQLPVESTVGDGIAA